MYFYIKINMVKKWFDMRIKAESSLMQFSRTQVDQCGKIL